MNSVETLQRALTFAHEWIKPIAVDLSDSPLTSPTPVNGNHPLWVMGHIAFSNAGLASMISGQTSPLQDWQDLFGGGTQPEYQTANYPDYATILQRWEEVHLETMNLLTEIGEVGLDQRPVAVWEPVREDPDFQTNGRLFLFLAMHEMSHRGQLADTRNALGRKPFV